MSNLPPLPPKKSKEREPLTLTDLEYVIKMVLPIVVLMIGVFGEPIGLSKEDRATLVTSGLFASGMSHRDKVNRG